MSSECYTKSGEYICVVICGKLVCDEAIVKDYGSLCESCLKGDRAACVQMSTRYGCWSTSGWWW